MRYLIIICLLVAAVVILAYTQMVGPHRFSDAQCPDCHVDSDRNPKKLTATITKLCKGCHSKTVRTSSHPVDIVPEFMQIPADLPLTDGKITCNTCHNVHADAKLAFGYKSFFLRRPTVDFRFFCLSCHKENLTAPGHRELTSVAHLGSKYRITDPSEPLDALSLACLACHDSSSAKGVNVEFGTGVWKHIESDHPVGVHYMESRMKTGKLRAVPELDKRIKFFKGRIGCGTCHDAYSKIPGKLVMDNNGSRLCIACHYNK